MQAGELLMMRQSIKPVSWQWHIRIHITYSSL